MTKTNPEILCPACKKFDYDMNRSGGVSMDVFVVCDCDENAQTELKPYICSLNDECEACQ